MFVHMRAPIKAINIHKHTRIDCQKFIAHNIPAQLLFQCKLANSFCSIHFDELHRILRFDERTLLLNLSLLN